MKNLRIVGTFSMPIFLFAFARATEPTPLPHPYAAWDPWIGGVWSIPIPANKDGITGHIEVRYSWTENREGIMINASTFKRDKEEFTVTGLFVWNPAQNRFFVLEGSSDGTVEEGTAILDGDDMVFEVSITKKDGTIYKGRSRLTKLGSDSMHIQVSLFRNGQWANVVDQTAERHGR
jgi:hypothetical protein